MEAELHAGKWGVCAHELDQTLQGGLADSSERLEIVRRRSEHRDSRIWPQQIGRHCGSVAMAIDDDRERREALVGYPDAGALAPRASVAVCVDVALALQIWGRIDMHTQDAHCL